MPPKRDVSLDSPIPTPHHIALSTGYTDHFAVPQQWFRVPPSMIGPPVHFGTGYKEGRCSGARSVGKEFNPDMDEWDGWDKWDKLKELSFEELKELDYEMGMRDVEFGGSEEYRQRYHYDPKIRHITDEELNIEVFGEDETPLPELPPDHPYTHASHAYAAPNICYPPASSIPRPPTPDLTTQDLLSAPPITKDTEIDPNTLLKATPYYVPQHLMFAPPLEKLTKDGEKWTGYRDMTVEGQNRWVECDPEEGQCREYYSYRKRKLEEEKKTREGEGKWWERMCDKAEGKGRAVGKWWLPRG